MTFHLVFSYDPKLKNQFLKVLRITENVHTLLKKVKSVWKENFNTF